MTLKIERDSDAHPKEVAVFPAPGVRWTLDLWQFDGRAIDTQDTLAFSVLQDVRPMIETLPLEKAPEAYARMMDGKARFRMVLVNGKD